MTNLFRKIIPGALLLCNLAVAAEPQMLINFGVGGGWYEPTTSGQGLVFDIVPSSNQLVAYWFTYPEDGEAQEWFVAQGDISGNRGDLTIYRTANGRFNQPSEIELTEVGNVNVEFASCEEASWLYSFDTNGLSGEIDLVRLGPTEFCEQFLAGANLDAVGHTNSWVEIGGTWQFDGCIELGANSSHGREIVVFTESTMTLEIDNYQTPNCQGPVSVQTLDFELHRIDKTTALLDGEVVIANRFLLVDPVSGHEIPQLWYVNDRNDEIQITHGVLDSLLDQDGYPTEVHTSFFTRQR